MGLRHFPFASFATSPRELFESLLVKSIISPSNVWSRKCTYFIGTCGHTWAHLARTFFNLFLIPLTTGMEDWKRMRTLRHGCQTADRPNLHLVSMIYGVARSLTLRIPRVSMVDVFAFKLTVEPIPRFASSKSSRRLFNRWCFSSQPVGNRVPYFGEFLRLLFFHDVEISGGSDIDRRSSLAHAVHDSRRWTIVATNSQRHSLYSPGIREKSKHAIRHEPFEMPIFNMLRYTEMKYLCSFTTNW